MKLHYLRVAASLTAAMASAISPLFVSAQTAYEFKKYTPGLRARDTSSQPGLQLSTTAVNFGNVATNTTETRQVLVSNSGTGSLSFTAAPAVMGDAAFTAGLTTCGSALAVGTDCLTDATFSPTNVGTYNGVLKFTSVLANSPHEVTLQGTAFNPVTLASTTLPTGKVGKAYSYDFKQLLNVSNENTPDKALAAWNVNGALPVGLSFDIESGVLSGTPPAAASQTIFDVTVLYKRNSTTQRFSLEVEPSATVVMNGSGYRSWSDGSVAENCLGYRQPPPGYTYTGMGGDGLYRVRPAGQIEATVYCDMATDGGGWTLTFAGDSSSSEGDVTVSQFTYGNPLKTYTYNSALRPVLPNGTTHQYNQSLFKGGVSQWVTSVGDWARFNSLRKDANNKVPSTLTGVLTSKGQSTLYLGAAIFNIPLAEPNFGLGFSPVAGTTGMCGGEGTPGPKYCLYFGTVLTDYAYHYETRSYRELYVR